MISFWKYEGAGNDFIIIDDRSMNFPGDDSDLIKGMCHRHFGIGADGLMVLRESVEYDFEMTYFNSDGRLGSMCGNGGRCMVHFAHHLGMIDRETSFMAVDGEHQAVLESEHSVSLRMIDVELIEPLPGNAVFMDTGSPHYVSRVAALDRLDVVAEGRKIRNSDAFQSKGVNVNFVEWDGDALKIRTYERGVEDETLACGTGVVAAAVAASYWGHPTDQIAVKAVGGLLSVKFSKVGDSWRNIWKTGPVKQVFKGDYFP